MIKSKASLWAGSMKPLWTTEYIVWRAVHGFSMPLEKQACFKCCLISCFGVKPVLTGPKVKVNKLTNWQNQTKVRPLLNGHLSNTILLNAFWDLCKWTVTLEIPGNSSRLSAHKRIALFQNVNKTSLIRSFSVAARVIITGIDVARGGRPEVGTSPDEATDLIRSSNPDAVLQ